MDIKAEIEAGKKVIAGLPDVICFSLIGSAMYLEDANDVDFVVLTEWRKASSLACELINKGWSPCSNYEVSDDTKVGQFEAVRLGNLNLIITYDLKFYTDYKTAMEVCKALRLIHREDRVAVCQIVRDGRSANEVSTYNELHGIKPAI